MIGINRFGSIASAILYERSHLYVLNAGTHDIAWFTVGAGGSLVAGKGTMKVPDAAAGLDGYL